MIQRQLFKELKKYSKKFQIISIFGPRQSGKTTLARMTFDTYQYVNLENIRERSRIEADPIEYLEQTSDKAGIIFDEVQNIPELFSFIQVYVDEHKKPGHIILTGSHNLLLNESITQSLAGRTAIVTLLPLSISELKNVSLLPDSYIKIIQKGSYPKVIASKDKLKPSEWYPSYIHTYVERDVRQLKNVNDLSLFQDFIGLCAGRIGQLLNLSLLANDCGITVNTAKSWLSILESSYIVFMIRQHHKNFNKRIVKTPKLYFYDTGLACSILGIENEEQLFQHYMRGNLFESFIISELVKHFHNSVRSPRIYFWRVHQGHEIDCIIDRAGKLIPIEIKSGKSYNTSFFDGLKYWNSISDSKPENGFIVYGGEENIECKNGKLISWKSIGKILKTLHF
jgi:uncharacterized protein